MARFDVYANSGKNRTNIPYLVDVQNNVISGLATRIVVPIRLRDAHAFLALPPDLFPTITVDGHDCFLDTPQLGAIPLSELKTKIGSAKANQHEIQVALDRVFGTF